MRIRLMLLGIKRRPAAAGRGVAAIAAAMDAERQPEFLCLFVDRPVAMPAERLVGARRDVDLHIAADSRATLDLGNGNLSVVLPDQDGGFQPRVAVAPLRQLPLVDRALDRRTEVEILLREDEQ